MKAIAFLLGACLALALPSTHGLAHHSTSGLYDEEQVSEVTGTVRQWRFVNPHPILILEVAAPDGQVHAWDISFGGPAVNILRRQGYTADTFTPGEVIVVKGFAAKTEGLYGMLVRGPVTRADGTPVLNQPAR